MTRFRTTNHEAILQRLQGSGFLYHQQLSSTVSSATQSSAPSRLSIVSLGNSHTSLPFDLAVVKGSVHDTQELKIKGTKHPVYFFKDGNIVL